jgi:acyl carrier protein
MNDRLHSIVSDVLGIPVGSISDNDSPSTIETWDSLRHISLVLAVEAEFGVSFSPDEAVEMMSVGLIRKILSDRGAGGD